MYRKFLKRTCWKLHNDRYIPIQKKTWLIKLAIHTYKIHDKWQKNAMCVPARPNNKLFQSFEAYTIWFIKTTKIEAFSFHHKHKMITCIPDIEI